MFHLKLCLISVYLFKCLLRKYVFQFPTLAGHQFTNRNFGKEFTRPSYTDLLNYMIIQIVYSVVVITATTHGN